MKAGTGSSDGGRFAWRGPLTVLPFPQTEAASLRMRRIVWLFMGLGIAARCMRMALRLPLWPDEAYLSASLIDRGYAGLRARLPLGAG